MKGEWKEATKKKKKRKQKLDTSPNRLSSDVMKTREHRNKTEARSREREKEKKPPKETRVYRVGRHITKEIFQHAGKEKGTRPILQWSPGEGMESAGVRRKEGKGDGQNGGQNNRAFGAEDW